VAVTALIAAQAGVPTVHGQLHQFAVIVITALAAGCFVLAAGSPPSPAGGAGLSSRRPLGWACIVFIAAFGAAGGHGGLTGLRERAAGGVTSVLTVAVLARLAAASRLAAEARRPARRPGVA
jgi:hypothetical protein